MTANNPLPSTAIRWAGIIAIFAALQGVIADLALQYTSNTAHLLSDQSLYLLDVPPSRLLLGHYLGVVAILVGLLDSGKFIAPYGLLASALRSLFSWLVLSAPCSVRAFMPRLSL